MAKKKPRSAEEATGEYPSLTADPSLHGIAAAALLLMGDLTADQQVDVLRAIAKPGVTIMEPDAPMKRVLTEALYQAQEAVGAVDGTSGLGRIAAQNAANTVKLVRDAVRRAAQYAGVPLS